MLKFFVSSGSFSIQDGRLNKRWLVDDFFNIIFKIFQFIDDTAITTIIEEDSQALLNVFKNSVIG